MTAALAEVLLLLSGRAFFADAGRFCVAVGAGSALGAAILGWCFAGFDVSDVDWVMSTHRWLGTATAVWTVVLLGLSECRHRRTGQRWQRGCRIALTLAVALVGSVGFLGGSLVYGIDHYAW